MTETIKG